jgi:hypothetical protein
MLGRNASEPMLFQMVDLEALVPASHRLRKIDAVLDLGFVREAVTALYHQSRGRPSIDAYEGEAPGRAHHHPVHRGGRGLGAAAAGRRIRRRSPASASPPAAGRPA